MHRVVETTELGPSDIGWAPTGMQIASRIRRAHHHLERELASMLRPERTSFPQLEVLLVLDDHPKLHAGGIARQLGIRRQSAHQLLTSLARDGRVNLLPMSGPLPGAVLTTEGGELISKCIDALEPVVGALGRLTAADRLALFRLLQQMEAALRPPPRRWWPD